jgi:hypothetical protein
VVAGGRVTLEVGAESEAARRALGAVAWSVLETLALTGQDLDGRWVATTNARDLASRLGVGKDRAAAALAALRRAGLVAPRASRDATTARFTASSYEITLPVSQDDDTSREPIANQHSSDIRPRRPRPRRRDDGTLDLFTSIS